MTTDTTTLTGCIERVREVLAMETVDQFKSGSETAIWKLKFGYGGGFVMATPVRNLRICPRCGSTRWQAGPRGGDAQNFRCENGHILWYSPPFTTKVTGFQALGTLPDLDFKDGRVYGDPK